MTEITIPVSVSSIGIFAFQGAGSLTAITLPGVTSIGLNAFSSATGLTTVTIADGQIPGVVSPATNVSFFGASVNLLLPLSSLPLSSFQFEYNQSEFTASITGVTVPSGSSSLHFNTPATINYLGKGLVVSK